MSKRIEQILLTTATWHLLVSALTRDGASPLTHLAVNTVVNQQMKSGVYKVPDQHRGAEASISSAALTFLIPHQRLSVSVPAHDEIEKKKKKKTLCGNVKPFRNGSQV